jgi:nitrate reductase gamma subunit
MGPLRRQLITLLASTTPAWAEVCDKDRPAWTTADGPVTQWGEALYFMTTLPPVLLIGALIAGWVFRQPLLFNIVIILASVLMFPLIYPPNAGTLALAIVEGCRGPTTIVIGILAAICCAALAGLILRRKGMA